MDLGYKGNKRGKITKFKTKLANFNEFEYIQDKDTKLTRSKISSLKVQTGLKFRPNTIPSEGSWKYHQTS